MHAPQLSTQEALYAEMLHFVDCIARNQEPLTNGQAGLRVVQILEAASRSLAQRGQPVELCWDTALEAV
jgi:predicted dehydrogenase